jgi:hypothetical protein
MSSSDTVVSGPEDHLNNNCCTSSVANDSSTGVADDANAISCDETDNARFGCPKGCDIVGHRKGGEVCKERHEIDVQPVDETSQGITNGNGARLSESASNHSVGGSPNSTGHYRSTVLANFNSWFTEISSSSLFHSFTNPFRRRNSRHSAVDSPTVTRSNSKLLPAADEYGKDSTARSKILLNAATAFAVESKDGKLAESPEDESEAVRKFIGAIHPTLKGKELIELANFGVVEIEPQEPGLGHRFEVSLLCFFIIILCIN